MLAGRLVERGGDDLAGRRACQVGDFLPDADVVVVLAPVTTETIGMVDAAFLARMKDGALLVNAARGSLVTTDALCSPMSVWSPDGH